MTKKMEELIKKGFLTNEEVEILSAHSRKKQKDSTPEEKNERQNEYARNYYDRNKEKIKQKNLARYYKQKLSKINLNENK